jgi:aspartyl-tRNA synthetase
LIEGANLLTLKYREAGRFAADPSQIVRPVGCNIRSVWSIDDALRAVPRDRFDFVWIIDPPPFDTRLTAGMQPVWRGPGSILYRVQP